MIYTGIGSRESPPNILEIMIKIGRYFALKKLILRSGGADGADSAFEKGCDLVNGKKEIFLPWKYFNKNKSELYTVSEESINLAKQFHPAWDKLSQGAQKLHARNCNQILGEDLKTLTDFVLCYSKGTGGTEQALRIAKMYNVPIFNMYKPDWNIRLKEFLFKFKK